jgi:glycosyltransferase involved in cell wall biosynthesis
VAKSSLNKPLVSVIIPAYNAEKYIAETIQSVIDQTYTNIEIIVVNDGSTDNTQQVVETAFGDNKTVYLIYKENAGAAAARNSGYQTAKGDLIKFLDGDDLINPEMIEQQLSLVENEHSIISAKWGRFNQNDITNFSLNPEDCWQTLPAKEWIKSSWQNAQSMTTPGIFLIPKQLIEKAGLWDESLSLLDDTEYFTRTILAADKVIFSKESTLYYRSGNVGNLSGQLSESHAWSAYLAILKSTQYLVAVDVNTRLLCANFLQTLLYTLYPNFPKICAAIEAEIKALGGSKLAWPASPLAKALQPFIGWKAAKKLMQAKRKFING